MENPCFVVVSYYENSSDKLGSLYTVPSGWISKDSKYLFYPNSRALERRIISDVNSVADETTWKKSKCRVRKGEFQTYKEATEYEEKLANLTDTESEER